MNAVYRVVWNAASGQWVVASELAKGRKKKSSVGKLAAMTLALAGIGAPAVFAADAPSSDALQCKTNEVVSEGACILPVSIAPFFADGGGNDNGSTSNVAIGTGAATLGNNSVAIGLNATTNDVANVAIGHGANTTGSNAVATGFNAKADGNYAITYGGGASAVGSRTTALGTDAAATNVNATAVGNGAKAAGTASVALGNNSGVDATAGGAVAIGSGARVNADMGNAIALGNDSIADRARALSVGATGAERQIVHVAAGVQNTDAVNVSQLKPIADGIGASIDPVTGVVTGPTYNVGGANYTTVGSALNGATRYFKANGLNNDSDAAAASGLHSVAMGPAAGASSQNAIAIGWGARASTNEGTIAIGANARASGENSVALGNDAVADRDNVLSVGSGLGGNGTRQIINVANGTQGTDAVNVNQLKPAIDAIGGGAAINPSTGVVTGPTYNIGGNTYNNVGDALTNIDGRTTINEGDITNLKNGTLGLVTQADPNAAVNVATASGGTSVNFAGTAGDRQLNGVAAGSADTDAVNVRQLKDAGIVGDDGSLANVVTYDDASKGGVSLGGTSGTVIRNVNAGIEDKDAVNVSQLKPVVDAIGGGATIDPVTGVVTGPTYNIGGNIYNNVGDAITNIDGRTTVNEGDITNLKNGTLGLVTQADANAVVNVATATGGTSVNFAGTAGDRQLKGVAEGTADNDGVNVTQLRREIAGVSAGDTRYFKADGKNDNTDDAQVIGNNSVAIGAGSVAARDNTVDVGNRQITGVVAGTADTDAVNVSQLKGAGLIGGDGSLLDAVVYDAGSNRGVVTFGGTAGTRLTNVMAGLVAPGSMDAINGSQLWAVQDQVNKLGDRVTNIEIGGGTGPVIPVTPDRPVGEGAGRDPHFASSGDATKPAQATGDNAAAVGAGSVADRDNTVSVGSKDNERQVTNVAAGTQETDAANWGQVQDALRTANGYTDDRFNTLDRRIDKVGRKANAGVASALAAASMPQAYAPGLNSVGVGVGSYGGQSAIAIGASTISESGRWVFKVNGTSSTNGEKGVGAGAAMVW